MACCLSNDLDSLGLAKVLAPDASMKPIGGEIAAEPALGLALHSVLSTCWLFLSLRNQSDVSGQHPYCRAALTLQQHMDLKSSFEL